MLVCDYRSSTQNEIKGLATRSNTAIRETRDHLDGTYTHILREIKNLQVQNHASSMVERKNEPALQTTTLPAKLAKRLDTVLIPVLISVNSFNSKNMMDLTLSVRRGRVIVERWTTSGKAIYEVLSPEPSYGIEISMQINWIVPTRISLIVLMTMRLLARWSFLSSIQIKSHKIVPTGVGIAEAVRIGNVNQITKLFSEGRARPTDVLLNGYSLIHVRCFALSELLSD